MTRNRLAFLLIATFSLFAMSCEGTRSEGKAAITEGDQAPSFTLPSAGGDDVALSDFSGERPVLLYFSMGPG